MPFALRKQAEVEFVLAAWFPDHVGKNAACVVKTQDCRSTYETLKDRRVKFNPALTEKPYGLEAVFQDLYGNVSALVERKR